MHEPDHMSGQRANSLGFAIRPEHKYFKIRYSVDLIANFFVRNYHSYKNLITFDTTSEHKTTTNQSRVESVQNLVTVFNDLLIRFLKPNFVAHGVDGAPK
jgi:hypothetical protein